MRIIKEQVTIYPYNNDYEPFINHKSMIHSMEIISLVSPKGWGMTGDVINSDDSLMEVHDNFSVGINSCTTVWFVEDDLIPLPHELLFLNVTEAIEKKKKIIFSRYKDKQLYQEVDRMIPTELKLTPPRYEVYDNLFNPKKLYSINIPIVIIAGISEKTDKFSIQVKLRNQFMKRGYKVSSVSTRLDSSIIGMHPLPSFMLDNHKSTEERILEYNHFIKHLELIEQPEIIIIGIPGGVLPYNNYLYNKFGVMAFEICNSVRCDCAVLCSLFSDYSHDYFDEIAEGLFNKYEMDILYHHIAARMRDNLHDSINEYEFNYLSLDENYVKEKIKACGIMNAYNMLDVNDASKVVENIIEKFSYDDSFAFI
ncbi:MAG: TIGR04066 family peptide maturation system protein [Oscillospiraceae bacterium]|nr:TIGR04066 family peptide maturation system protein [Oscillospiraceae bacterium]